MTFKLNKPFASAGKVDPTDVRVLKKALNRLGYYMPFKETGVTDIPDRDVFDALQNFQSDQGLKPTGAARPGDATVKALNAAQGEQKKRRVEYIWMTVGDGKVRNSHAALHGERRVLDEDSLDPGEDPNCRCWMADIEVVELDNQLCINIWTSLTGVRDKLEKLREQKAKLNALKNENEENIDFLKSQINQILNDWLPDFEDFLPDLAGINSAAFIRRVERILKRLKGAFDVGQVLSLLQGIEDVQKQVDILMEQIQKIEENIQELIKRERELEEEFSQRCPGFFE